MTQGSLPARRLGRLQVSSVGLGCNNFGGRIGPSQTEEVVEAALQAGINFFDTADIYGGGGESERLLAAALGDRRSSVVIATKFGMAMPDADGYPQTPRGSRTYIRHAVERSLQRLGIQRIDLYQYHQPDGVTPLSETLAALDELVREGLVCEIGASNFSAAQLREAAAISEREGLARFVSVQNRYSLLEREIEHDVAPLCQQLSIGILPYYPLASGLLTGKYRRGQPAPEGTRLAGRGELADERTFARIEALERFAAERDLAPVQVAIGALAAQPAVASVIAGATSAEQVQANAAAAGWSPDEQELAELDRIFPPGG